MDRARRTRRPNGSKLNPVRSVRCSDAAWDAAKARADAEGVTMSDVLVLIIEGWAAGLIDLPVWVLTYSQPRRPTE